MSYPNRPRSSRKNGSKWTKIAGVAKRQWAREPGPTLCHLCFGEIDTTAPAKANRSLSIDHVIPVAVDPTLEYRLSNLKPACWICNSVRGDRPLEEVHADVAGFKREVDRAIARRIIADEARLDKISAGAPNSVANFPPIRDFFGNLENENQRQKRYAEYMRLPPEWR